MFGRRARAGAGLVVMSLLSVGSAVGPAAPAGAAWSIIASPNAAGATFTRLYAVSCVRASDCAAVGYATVSGSYRTLAERWNGTSWSIIASPNAAGATDSRLFAVSCVGALDCTAVGYATVSGSDKTLVEHWNGTAWSIVASPNAAGATFSRLFGVSCVRASDCTAVGAASLPNGAQTLVEHWNGTAWSIVTSENPAGATFSRLYGASCVGASDCTAVGYATVSGSDKTLVEHWNGTAWSIVASPNPAAATESRLYRVSCVGASVCTAIGYATVSGSDKTLVEHWNGITWSIVASPNPAAATLSRLFGVSCAGASDCTAVGYANPSGSDKTLVEHWNGTAWSIVASPNPAGATLTKLSGVSCVTAPSCTAVGVSYSATAVSTLVLQWPSWAVAASPNPTGATGSRLNAVACVSTIDCTAVGTFSTAGFHKTLVERWNGTAWAVVVSPNPAGATDSELMSVSCTSASNCDAVGFSTISGVPKSLVERWNGTVWSIVASPNPSGATNSKLYGVSCATIILCQALGASVSGGSTRTLAEQWNGTRWSIIASSNPSGASVTRLSGVSCAGASLCRGVGFSIASGSVRSLTEVWTGTTWSIVASPPPVGATASSLLGVSCAGATCHTVGSTTIAGVHKTLTEEWTGSSWSIATSAKPPGALDVGLNGVACVSTGNCYAVGFAIISGFRQTLIEHFDGTSWSLAASFKPAGATYSSLSGVACRAAANCNAVGDTITSGIDETLVEHSS